VKYGVHDLRKRTPRRSILAGDVLGLDPIQMLKFHTAPAKIYTQIEHAVCFSKRSDPKSVEGILYYGNWQENKNFLLTLFEPEAPAVIHYLEPPATQFHGLLLEDDLSSGIHIHKSIFEHFHKQFKNFLLKGTNL
jgi:hypothetical protein